MRKMNLRSLVIFIVLSGLILGSGNELEAKTYYVSSSGSNSNPGKIGSPFLTIQHGVDVLRAGDSLFVRGGTYFERVAVYGYDGTSTDPIVILNYPGENPVIDGGSNLPKYDWSQLVILWEDYVYFKGFEVRNSNRLGYRAGGDGITAAGAHDIIANCKVHDCWNSGIYIGDYGIAEYNEVYNTCLSNSANPGSTINGSGVSAAGNAPASYADYSIIRHNIVHDIWGEAVSTFESNHCTIEDNIIYDGWSAFIYVSDATYATVQRNLVYQTKTMSGGTQVGILFGDEINDPVNNGCQIINNLVYGCRANLELWNATHNCIIANNTFVNGLTYNILLMDVNYSATIFTNNLILQESQIACAILQKETGITFSYNLWSKSTDTDAVGTGDVVGYPDLAKTGSTGAGKLTAEYFKLLGSSPAINKGVVLSNIKQDYFGNTRDNYPDIGAYEYTTSNQTIRVTGITVTGINGVKTISTNNGTLQLSAAISPTNATNKSVAWSIQNGTGQASISSSGLITALSNGTVTARATAMDGSGVYGTLGLTISNQTAPTGNSIVRSDGCSIITARSGYLSREIPNMAFDNYTSTKWYNYNVSGNIWIQYQFCNGASYIINSYTLTSANDMPLRDPKTVSISGSNDGVNFTLLDTKTNITFSSRFQKQTFSFTNTKAYQYYRLDMAANPGNDGLQVSEIELIETGSTLKSTQMVEFSEGMVTVSPNPFREALTIDYNLPGDTHVNLVVYDLNGRMIRQLVNENQTEGSHRIVWDALNSSGNNLHNGIYILKMESAFGSEISKIIYSE
jgi:hypothetical protein